MNNDLKKLDRKEKKRLLKEASDKIGRPFLFNRLMSGMLDLLTIAILSVGFFLLFFMPSKSQKYDLLKERVNQECLKSGLYEVKDDKVTQKLINYTTAEEMIEFIDPSIISFYSTNQNAIEDGKLEEYTKAKLDSKLFELDGDNIVIKTPYDSKEITTFFEVQYSNANEYFTNLDEVYAYNIAIVYNILTCVLFSVIISSLVFYLVIPLCHKEGETLFQRVFKICLIDSRDNGTIKKSQIVVRYFVVTGIYLLLPIVMFRYNFGELSLIPIAVGIFMVCLTKKSKGPQDYISYSQVILKHRSGVLETYKEIRK